MERLVTFENEGQKLYGVVGLPAEGTPMGCVVFVHGWGGCRMGPHRIIVQSCRTLNARGYASLRFDLRGRGESEGDDTNLDGMISDTCEAAKFLMAESGCKTAAVWGVCSGGNVAIGAATLMPEIDRLICWSVLPFQTHKSTKDDIKKTGSNAASYVKKAFKLETWKKLVGGRINFSLVRRVLFGHYAAPKDEKGENPKDSKRDIVAAFESYKGRVLFVYGGADPEAAGAQQMYEPFCQEHGLDAEFHVIEGANHSFYSTEWKEQVVELSMGWLEKQG